MKIYVIGDIHGGFRALQQCLSKASFDYDKDKLICLGDVADGWPETPACIDELLKIKNLIYIRGNHDVWMFEWYDFGIAPDIWLSQGGQATVDAYNKTKKDNIPKLKSVCHNYYLDDENRIFVHGGFVRGIEIECQTEYIFTWDRTLVQKAYSGRNDPYFKIHEFNEVYLGHTTVNSFRHLRLNKPFNAGNVWLLDTGAGFEGVLTIMDIDTKKYWQSDTVASLYPKFKGRI